MKRVKGMSTVAPDCPCGSGLPVEDDGMCLVCWYEQQPVTVAPNPDFRPWMLSAARHAADREAQQAADARAGGW